MTMNTTKILLLVMTVGCFFSNISSAQKLIDDKKMIGEQIIQKLNVPTKIWVDGHWEIKLDGTRVWKKGHWRFEEKSFQQKSEIYRKKMIKRQKV